MKQREIARLAKVLCARFIETAVDAGGMFASDILSDDDVVALEQACWRISDDLYNRGSVLGHDGPVVTMGDALRVAGVVVEDKPPEVPGFLERRSAVRQVIVYDPVPLAEGCSWGRMGEVSDDGNTCTKAAEGGEEA